ncbi:unnamed protein product [Arctia plantaginis]|uniref:Uncharacterized protein n=1 Tax=Arctia plantaginis TaxID=874455 RepID=A0A8S1B3J3_ARCPL|nr:unnamed protein product [Arctia plantaginis]
MSATGRLSVLRKHKIQGRTAKILALIPMQHAPSETSDKSDPNSDNELVDLHSPSLVSSSPPSLDSSLERMHILSSCESSDSNNDDDNHSEPYPSVALQLSPVLRDICPATPTREPNYENIPSLSSILSLPSVAPSSTLETSTIRKTRAQKQIAPVAKRTRRVPKFILTYKWKKSTNFHHRATIEENYEDIIDTVPTPYHPMTILFIILIYFFLKT